MRAAGCSLKLARTAEVGSLAVGSQPKLAAQPLGGSSLAGLFKEVGRTVRAALAGWGPTARLVIVAPVLTACAVAVIRTI